MAWSHPIGDDHPFPAVYALARAQNLHTLEMVNVYDGALIRLFHRELRLVFKRDGDPGSAMDRQRFDYYTHIQLPDATPQEMLDTIRSHIAERGLNTAGRPEGDQ